jgi:hypothetical protein
MRRGHDKIITLSCDEEKKREIMMKRGKIITKGRGNENKGEKKKWG